YGLHQGVVVAGTTDAHFTRGSHHAGQHEDAALWYERTGLQVLIMAHQGTHEVPRRQQVLADDLGADECFAVTVTHAPSGHETACESDGTKVEVGTAGDAEAHEGEAFAANQQVGAAAFGELDGRSESAILEALRERLLDRTPDIVVVVLDRRDRDIGYWLKRFVD